MGKKLEEKIEEVVEKTDSGGSFGGDTRERKGQKKNLIIVNVKESTQNNS